MLPLHNPILLRSERVGLLMKNAIFYSGEPEINIHKIASIVGPYPLYFSFKLGVHHVYERRKNGSGLGFML